MFARQFTVLAIVIATAVGFSGCGPAEDPRQVYADALNLYNSESEALERLQQKRQRIVDEHEKQVAAIVHQHKQAAVAELLGGLGNLNSGDEPLTEDNVLDRLDEVEGLDPEAVLRRAQDVDAALKTLPAEAQQDIDRLKTELEAELAPVDTEIAQQQQRVDNARQAKETAEAAMNR
jgi:hypothetical protein